MKIKTLALAMAAIMLTANGAGAQINKMSCDYETGVWHVQGSFSNLSGKNAAAEVLKPGKTVNDSDAYAYAGEIPIDDEGNFDASFKLGGNSGEYMFRIGSDGQVFEKNFIFLNPAEMEDYLAAVNAASSYTELMNIFEKDYQRLKNICGISVKPAEKNFVYSSLYKEIPDGGFKSFDELKRTAARVVLLKNFMQDTQNPAQSLEKLFEYFDDKYLSAIDVWKNTAITDEQLKLSICSAIRGEKPETIEELETAFCENTLKLTLESAQKKTKGKELTIVKTAHSLIGASQYDYFAKLSEEKQISILKDITSSAYTSVSAYARALDNAISNYKKNLDNKKDTSPSGGSSGKDTGSIGGYVTSPTSKPETTPNPTAPDGNGGVFSDISDYNWARTAIEKLYANNTISGRGNGMFAPGENVLREEFTAMIMRAFSMLDESAAYSGFEDVSPDKWYYSAICSAVANGAVSGISETQFGIEQNITRQDAVLICRRIAEKLGVQFEDADGATHTSYEYATAKKDVFADQEEIADYAESAVVDMYNTGVVRGKSETEFKPLDNMTRAEAAVLIDKLTALVGGKSEINDSDKKMLTELSAFGLYSAADGEDISKELTRGETAELVCSFLNIPKNDAAEYKFSDCTKDNAYAGAVYAAVERGYMDGGEDRFYPDEPIEYKDAVKIAVRALGADEIVKRSSSGDYVTFAAQKGILSGVGKSGNYITKRDFIKMFYNMLDKSVYLADLTNKEMSYTESVDETFLSSYHGIYKDSGKVTANPRAGIGDDARCGKGKLKIDSAEFINANDEYNDCIGMEVTYYYKDIKDGDYELVYLAPKSRTKLMTLTSEQIESYKNRKYTYKPEENSNRKTIEISAGVNVIYNTSSVYDYSEEQMFPKSGSVTFIDADGDGRYTKADTLIIKDYKDIVVGSVNKTKSTIYDKYNPNEEDGYTLDLSQMDSYTIKDKHGDTYGFNELREWDVLSALVSPDKEYAELTLIDEAYAGKVSGVDIDEREITVDGQLYKLSKDWRGDLSFATGGSGVTIYWDLFGKVAAVREGIAPNAPKSDSEETDGLTERLVILTRYGKNDTDDEYYIRSYYSDDKITYNAMAEKIRLNNKRIESADAEETLTNQLGRAVIIRTDENDVVKEIVTAAMPGEDSHRGLWQINYPGESMLYKGDTKTFGNRFIAGDNIYTVPRDSDDYRNAAMFAYNNASFTTDQSYAVDAYITNINNIKADAVVYKSTKSSTSTYEDDTGYVISSVRRTLNADDESVLMMDGYSYDYIGGTVAMHSYELKEDAVIVDVSGNIRDDITLDELEAGDCIRFGLENGKIKTVMLAYDYSRDQAAGNTTRSGYTYEGYAYSMSDDQGYLSIVEGRHPKTIDISSYETGGKYINSFWIRNASLVTVVDKTGTKAEVTTGTMNDIVTYKNAGNDCSRIVLFSSWQSFITGIVVYVE